MQAYCSKSEAGVGKVEVRNCQGKRGGGTALQEGEWVKGAKRTTIVSLSMRGRFLVSENCIYSMRRKGKYWNTLVVGGIVVWTKREMARCDEDEDDDVMKT